MANQMSLKLSLAGVYFVNNIYNYIMFGLEKNFSTRRGAVMVETCRRVSPGAKKVSSPLS